jgi:response regulator RpfG family c-di-GMP phosphodiesterase
MNAAVLFVDDEKTILDALRTQVRGIFGRRVVCETAEHVDEAWEVLEELTEDPDHDLILIVSDWLMPGTRGDEFLAQVRARYPSIVRVMLTGQADGEALARVRDEQLAHMTLFKPWQEQDLRSAFALAFQE